MRAVDGPQVRSEARDLRGSVATGPRAPPEVGAPRTPAGILDERGHLPAHRVLDGGPMDRPLDSDGAGPALAGTDLYALLEALPLPVIVSSARDATVLFANSCQLRTMRASGPGDVVGRPISDFVHPCDIHRLVEAGADLRAYGTAARIEALRGVDCEGSEFEADVHTVLMQMDAEPVTVTISVDPRDRSEAPAAPAVAEREPDEAELKARAMVDMIPIGIMSFRIDQDAVPRLVSANPAADEIMGRDHRTLVGLTAREVLPGLPALQPEGDVSDADLVAHWRDREIHYDDGDFAGDLDVRLFRTSPGTVSVAFMDISDRKLVERETAASRERLEIAVEERTRELTEADAELERATRAKSAFLAAMSHELRTPLNSVIGFSGLLLQGLAGELTEEQRTQIDMINKSGKQLFVLVGDLLDLEKIESGRVALEVDEFDVPRVVTGLASSVRPMVEDAGLTLDVDVSSAPATMVSDRQKVEQVLLNFLSNAIKYTDQGGITLTVTALPGGEVSFSVADTGIGISPEDRIHVFDEFRQLQPRASAKNPGSGLGLALSKQLATLLEGHIRLVSIEDVGSTFALVVPDLGYDVRG
jgi:signal transduction histidine kinase